MIPTVLLVPGFVTDTYSEIERSYVELCSDQNYGVKFLWLVPDISSTYNVFAKQDSRHLLAEPIYVRHLREKGIPFVIGNISKYNVIGNFLLFRKIFRTHHVDAVYTHFGFVRFWATFFGKLLGKVTIWNEHWHSLGRRYALAKRIFYRVFVDDFISISGFITSTLPKNSRVHTVPNAIHAEMPLRAKDGTANQMRRQLGLPEEAVIVLMVAAFRSEKRHLLALEVCRDIIISNRQVIFVFLGDGELRGLFLERAKEVEIANLIVAPGHVDNVDDYYAVADISILTSEREPFGYVVLEAMRYGLPVIAFNTGGPAEVLQNDETGILVREGDVLSFTRKLLELIDDASLRTRLGTQARQSVKVKYSREVWIQQLCATLREIIVSRGIA